jgi:hypothetical protein
VSIASLINRPATLVRRTDSGKTDEFGNPVMTVTETEVLCELQQQRRNEEGDQGELSETLWNLFLPAGAELDTGDAIVVDGDEYELVGAPWDARNPRTQQVSHVEATVRRTAGAGD